MKQLFLMLCALLISYAAVAQGHISTINGGSVSLPDGCRQVVVVEQTLGINAEVHWLLLGEDNVWRGSVVKGVVGYGGIAPKGEKREGDGKTPQGLFELRRGLCYVEDFVTTFPMERYTEEYMWDENVNSATYNTLVRAPEPGTKGDRLWERRDTQYRYIVVVEYNTDEIVRGAGSAIFIHAWRAEGKPTAGCVGMSESSVKQLVEWLDPQLKPHIVVLPAGDRLIDKQ